MSNLPAGAKVIRVDQDGGLNKFQTVYQTANGGTAVRLVQQVPTRQIVLPQGSGQQVIVQQQQTGQPRQVLVRKADGQHVLVNQVAVSQPGQQIIVQQSGSQGAQPRQMIIRPSQVGQPSGQTGQVVYKLAGGQSVQAGQQMLIRQPGGQTVRVVRPVGQLQGRQIVIQKAATALPNSQSGQMIVQQGTQYVVQSSSSQSQAQIAVPRTSAVATTTTTTNIIEEEIASPEVESSPSPPAQVEEAQGDGAEPTQDTAEPQVDIDINNVVCSFNTRCHLNLKKIATEGFNVIYKRENGMVNMKLRRPQVTASIWSSGKITCTGATSEEASKVAARRVSRILQKLGFRIRFCNFRVVNVLGTCSLPWGIRITQFSSEHKENACYEPELHPGVTYRIKSPKATLKIFSTGSITVTAPCVANVGMAIEHIYPLVYPYRVEVEEEESADIQQDVYSGVHQYEAPGKIPRQRAITQPYKRARLDISSAEEDSEDYEDYDSEDEEY